MLKISFTAATIALLAILGPARSAPAPSALAAEGDVESGRKLFAQCRACHETEAGRNKVGPSLHGLFGRKSGAVEGFKYSPAITQAAIVWDDRTIGEYLANPRDFIRGNRMAYAGLKDDKQRADIIAFLRQATK
jgi:cytochrome c